MSRPEIGELAEGAAGGSSTMPGKANPVLSVLVRRAALTTPQLAATLHLAAASQVDDRADGGWHVEWATLRDLVRRTLAAASQAAELVGGLQVHADRMAATLAAAGRGVHAEQRAMTDLTGRDAGPDVRRAGRRDRRRRHRARPTPLEDRMIPVVTALRLSDADHRDRAAAAGPRPVARHLRRDAVGRLRRATSPTTSTWSRWDLPGHGHNRSVPEGAWSMADLAAGVLRAVDEVLAERGDIGAPFAYAG